MEQEYDAVASHVAGRPLCRYVAKGIHELAAESSELFCSMCRESFALCKIPCRVFTFRKCVAPGCRVMACVKCISASQEPRRVDDPPARFQATIKHCWRARSCNGIEYYCENHMNFKKSLCFACEKFKAPCQSLGCGKQVTTENARFFFCNLRSNVYPEGHWIHLCEGCSGPQPVYCDTCPNKVCDDCVARSIKTPLEHCTMCADYICLACSTRSMSGVVCRRGCVDRSAAYALTVVVTDDGIQ